MWKCLPGDSWMFLSVSESRPLKAWLLPIPLYAQTSRGFRSAADPLTFALTAACVGLVSLAASFVPAHRATGVNPVEALHWE